MELNQIKKGIFIFKKKYVDNFNISYFKRDNRDFKRFNVGWPSQTSDF